MREIRTAYTVLEIEETATAEEIRLAWKALIKKHHPDKGGDQALFDKIQKSYDVLSDPSSRAEYDAKVRKVRSQEKIRSMQRSVYDTISGLWNREQEKASDYQKKRTEERVRRNRSESEHSSYFAEQDRYEREWQAEYDRIMSGYSADTFTGGVEQVLHSTEEILESVLSDGVVRTGSKKFEKDPVSVNVETEVKLDGKIREVAEELQDSILKAERLVRIFNRYTGGV